MRGFYIYSQSRWLWVPEVW